jgi:hypothetical protein
VSAPRVDVQHPSWCRGAAGECDALGSYTHTSPKTIVKTSVTTRLEIYVEGGPDDALTPPVLVVEEYGCRCRSCDARVLLVLELKHAAAAYEAMGRLLAAVGAVD